MNRRNIVKYGVASAGSGLLASWKQPIVNVVGLPIHAQTSCVLQINDAQPISVDTIYWKGVVNSVGIADINSISADIEYSSSSVDFLLTRSAGSFLAFPTYSIDCSGIIQSVLADSFGST